MPSGGGAAGPPGREKAVALPERSRYIPPVRKSNMRAETEKLVEDIKRSIGLLRSIFDFDAAKARLAELNAQAEDPTFWNDTARAQRVMQERNALDDQLNAIGRIERDLDDQVTMIELGDAEKDQRVVGEAEAVLRALKARPRGASSKRCCQAKPTPSKPISKSTPALAAPRARIGPASCFACIRAGPNSTATRWSF